MAFFQKLKSKKDLFQAVTGSPKTEKVASPKKRLKRRWQKLDPMAILGRRELIGGLTIQETRLILALWTTDVNAEADSFGLGLHLYEEVSLTEGVIREGRVVNDEAFLSALAKLREAAAKISLESVVVSIPSSLTQFMVLTFPPGLQRHQLEEAFTLAAESSFPLALKELYVDWITTEGHFHQKQEVIAGLSRRKDIDKYIALISQGGFSPIAVESHSMSYGRLWGTEKKEVKGRVVFFVEPSEIVAVIYNQEIPHTHIQIPLAVLSEGKEGSLQDQVKFFLLRIMHSAVSGEEKIEVGSYSIIAADSDKSIIKAILSKAKDGMPPEEDIASSVKLPAANIKLRDDWMGVALGAAMRGLIPRKLDTMISFMSIGTEAAYERARLVSLVDFVQKFSMSLGAFFVLLYGSVYLFIDVLGRGVDKSVEKSATPSAEVVSMREAAKNFNERVETLSAIEASTPVWEKLFQEVDKLRQVGIIFSALQVAASPENPTINLEGKAVNRDALLLLKANLESSPIFTFDPLPLSLLLGKENIIFNLRLRLKEPAQFFP